MRKPGMKESATGGLIAAALLVLACGGGGSGNGSIEGKFFFAADNGVNGVELWSYDSTGSPLMVENLAADLPAEEPYNSDPEYFTEYGGLVYFSADNEDGLSCIWATDGSGAWMVTEGLSLSSPAVSDNKIFFRAWNNSRYGLWEYDGLDLTEISSSNVFYNYMTAYDGKIIMSGYLPGAPTNTAEPFIYDGETISRLQDINPTTGSYPTYFTEYDGNLFFRAVGNGTDYELWATDGSSAWMVTPEINPSGSADPHYLTEYNGLLYFSATDGVNGQELWASDGSSSWMVTPEINLSGSAYPSWLTTCNGKLYFAAADGINGRELWEYDSTLNQVQQVADINTAMGASSNPSGRAYYPYRYVCLDNKLYFGANDGDQGYELYVYDGSTAELAGGTEMNPSGNFWFVEPL